MGKVSGIDLGTTNSCVSVVENEAPVIIPGTSGSMTTPSIVAFTKKGERLVGESARRQAVTNPERTISSVKRHMGTEWSILLSYFKCMDDWKDEGKHLRHWYASLLEKEYQRLKAIYPRQCRSVSSSIQALENIETKDPSQFDQAVALQSMAEDRGSFCNALVGIDVFGRFFPGEHPDFFLNGGNPGRPAYQKHAS